MKFFQIVSGKEAQMISNILYERDGVGRLEKYPQEVSPHALRRYTQRLTKCRLNSLECSSRIGAMLRPEYKRDHYMGKTVDGKYGTTYWYYGEENGKYFFLPQSPFGVIYTVYPWSFENHKLKYLKASFIACCLEHRAKRQQDLLGKGAEQRLPLPLTA